MEKLNTFNNLEKQMNDSLEKPDRSQSTVKQQDVTKIQKVDSILSEDSEPKTAYQ